MAFGAGNGQGTGRHGTFIEALNRDWDELVDRHRGSVAGWSRGHDALVECRSLTDVLLAAWGRPDAVCAALLTEVSKGDELAGRVVLQLMLGRIVRMAGRDPSAGIDDYVSALWCQIHVYPLDTRPVRIVANLSMDTLKAVARERRWLRHGEVILWPPEVFWEEGHEALFVQPEEVTLSASGLLTVGRDFGVIDAEAHALLVSVYIDELSGREAADRHWTTPASVRVRCNRAVQRLAAHRIQLLSAA